MFAFEYVSLFGESSEPLSEKRKEKEKNPARRWQEVMLTPGSSVVDSPVKELMSEMAS